MFRIGIGFIIGVIVSRNATQYSTPFWGAILLVCMIGLTLMYFFGRHDKNVAVATAVATAIASSKAEAEAQAQAIANSAVQIYMQSGQMPSPREMEIVAAYHSGEISHDDRQPVSQFTNAIDATREMDIRK